MEELESTDFYAVDKFFDRGKQRVVCRPERFKIVGIASPDRNLVPFRSQKFTEFLKVNF